MTIRWHGLVAPEEAATGDRRMFASQALTYRDFPLPAGWQRVTSSGHAGSVIVASWDAQYAAEGGIWGRGEFLDPRVVPEVVEAVYLLDKGLIGPSVDLDPDMAYEVVPHPDRPDEDFAIKVTRANVHALTFVMGPAFPQVHITVDDDEEMSILASAGVEHMTFAVNKSSWRSWPVAPRETEFDADDAIARIAQWSGGDPSRFSQAFLWQDKTMPPTNRESYRLPIADIHNGKLTLIPRAVFSAGTILSGAHGGLEARVPEAERIQLQQVVTQIYDVLRETYGDPRVIAPWQRGGRDGATSSEGKPTSTATLEGAEMFTLESEESSFAVRSGGWDSMPIGSGTWDEGAARQALDEWAGDSIEKYGRAFLWSDGSGSKTGFKFPIARPVDGTLTIIPAAVNNADARLNQANIPDADKSRIQAILDRIQKRFKGSGDSEMALTAAGILYPPREAFNDPKLKGETYLTITDDGRVFGHLAPWKRCHLAVGNKCVRAPKSATGYQYFKQGSVKCDDDSIIRVGKITIGIGHADPSYGVVPASEHYDDARACVAVVNVGEDKFGIWVAGALVAEADEARVAQLRRSPLSGDWRKVNGNLELVAALAVNDPGFPILGDGSLTAALMPAEGEAVHEHADHVFSDVDVFLNAADRAHRASVIAEIFQDLSPAESDCGCAA